MMDEMYGLQSSSDDHYPTYYPAITPPLAAPHTQLIPHSSHAADHDEYSAGGFGMPVFPPLQMMVGYSDPSSTAVSDAASMAAPEGRRIVGRGRGSSSSEEEEVSGAMRARIASHPLYPTLLQAYIDCQKVGAPPEIAGWLEDVQRDHDFCTRTTTSCLGADPELDDFMEAYCDVLVRYKSDLSRPFDEATTFLNNIQTQLNDLCNGVASRTHLSDEAAGSSEEEISGGEREAQDCLHIGEDHRDLKDKLLRKYSGYISTLKLEFSKKKKKGKLPKQARQTLLDWWNAHYKWPYPTEADKVALAEVTGLDHKQINNWFINQRKRHWKPSENMQFGVDTAYGPFFSNN